MCDLMHKLKLKSFTGFKVVIASNGKYYSPATGICYNNYFDGTPMPEEYSKAVSLCSLYCDGVPIYCKVPKLQGRTAVFSHISGAWDLAFRMTGKQYRGIIKIIEVEISGNLISGKYYYRDKVVAGNSIRFIKEVK